MSVYDCFMFFDEDLIAEIRFNVLDKYVDKFVVVEATRDHAGNPKKLNFKIDKFKKFKNKIIYYVVDDIPEKVENYKKGWSPNFFRENFHRNAISRAIEKCASDDLILISDADEIPNLELLKKIKINKFAIFKQKNFLYKLNLMSDENWLGSSVCYKKYLKSPQWLRNKRFLRRGFIRRFFFKTQIIENGGWHFTFLKKPEDIQKKMKSYGHGDLEKFSNLENIKKKIKENKFFIDETINLKKVDLFKNLPKFIVNNKNYYKEWIEN